jgi:hypothetical protein
MTRRITRATVEKSLAIAGATIVLVQLLMLARSPMHVLVTALGVGLICVGLWRAFSHWLPDRRKYVPLRSEVDEFIQLVRKLNSQRAQGDFTAAFETSAELRETVERVITAAGIQPVENLGTGVEAELQRQTLHGS